MLTITFIDGSSYSCCCYADTWRDANGDFHRDDDLPAVVGSKASYLRWYKHGSTHRQHQPAIMVLQDDRSLYFEYFNNETPTATKTVYLSDPDYEDWLNRFRCELERSKSRHATILLQLLDRSSIC